MTTQVYKQLAGMQDLKVGVGSVQQQRNNKAVTVNKIDVPFAVQSEAELAQVEYTSYPRAHLYSSDTEYVEYVYDATSTLGLPSSGPGTWVQFHIVDLTGSEVAIGSGTGTGQGQYSVAVGYQSGQTTQNDNAIAVGVLSGNSNQGASSVAVGGYSGQTTQGTNSVSVGYLAGQTTQGGNSVAVGVSAGNNTQGANSVAVGYNAGKTTQGTNSVAIGSAAGNDTQGYKSVAVGLQAGQTTQGDNAVAVGNNAGNTTQGDYSVAFGYAAGQINQPTNSICLNADNGGNNPSATKSIQIGRSDYDVKIGDGNIQSVSDARDKFAVEDIPLGLDFINALSPKFYKYDIRELYETHEDITEERTVSRERTFIDEEGNDITETFDEQETVVTGSITIKNAPDGSKAGNRFHSGFLAQDVKQVMDDFGVDFGLFRDQSIKAEDVHKEAASDKLALCYQELIAIQAKAIQELSAKVDALEAKVD